VVKIEFRWKTTGDKGGPPARHNKAQLQMKLRHVSLFVAGLLSFGAMAQVKPPATNPPMPASPVPAAAGGVVGPPAPGSPALAASAKPAEPPDKAQLSHALGIYYSQGVSNNMVGVKGLDLKTDVDIGVFIQTFSNLVAGVPMTLDVEDLRKVLGQWDTYHKEQIDMATNKLMATGQENKVKGEKFMKDIAATPGVTNLPSGVVYKVIKEGDGIKATSVDVATISFRESLIDNTEVWMITNTPARVSDPLLPQGIREVLLLMKAGSRWTVYLPYAQAYGEKAGIPDAKVGFRVGPYSAVVFDLEVESVQPRPAMPNMMGSPRGTPPPPPTAPTTAAPATGSATRVVSTDSLPGPTTAAPASGPPTPITSPIVRMPSAAEMERGEKPRQMTDAEVEAAKAEEAKKALTNAPVPK
jgi:FKBP-type peptidyl-prolyl cis-trans isomerase